jgi:oligopeptidase A
VFILFGGCLPGAEERTVLNFIHRLVYIPGYAWGIASHLNGVKNGDELRAAYEENQPKIVQANMKFSQSKPLYDALLKVQKGWEAADGMEAKDDVDDFAAAQRRRAVENSIRSMKLGGVGFEEGSPEQARYKEIKMRQAELSTAFSNNVLDATKAFGLDVTSPADVEGVPESAAAMWAQAYQQHAIKECKDDEDKKKALEEAKVDAAAGPWRITLDGPSYIAAMQHIPNRALRREVYLGYMTRASEFTAEKLEKMDEEKKKDVDEKEKKDKPGKNNVPIIKEILKNKKELSGLLGFANYAGECFSLCMK